MAVLTTSGRVAIATAIKARTAHMAWGSGDVAWPSTPPPSPPINATALVAEIARRKANQVEFCAPAPAGAISVPEGRFDITSTPTNNLYFKFHFEFTDAPTATIREAGIFLDTVLGSGVPAGQFYLLPADVAQPGTLLVLERPTPIIRSAAKREMFEFVVTF